MLELAARIMCSLVVVFGLLWALARLARRGIGNRGGDKVAVLARQQLTRGAAVAVVRVADRALVLGVTDQGVSLLADADPKVFEDPVATPAPIQLSGGLSGGLSGSLLAGDTWKRTLRFMRGDRT